MQRIIGPLRPPPEWRELRTWATALAARAADPDDPCGTDFTDEFSRLYSQWADAAEVELVEATGAHYFGEPKRQGLRGKAPALVWRSIVPERPPRDGADGQTQWRSVAARAIEVQRSLHHMLATDPALDDHAVPEPGVPADDADGDPLMDGLGGAHVQLGQAAGILDDILGELDQFDAGTIDDELAGAVAALRDIASEAKDINSILITAQANAGRDDIRAGIARVNDVLGRLTDVREIINRGLYAAAEACKRKGLEEWREWVRRNIDAGARHAHKYLALPEEWQPTSLLTADGVLSSNPLQLIDSYRLKYDQLWNRRAPPGGGEPGGGGGGGGEGTGGAKPSAPKPWHDVTARSAYPRARPGDFREAAITFRERTLVAFDGIAMRHYALLSDEALEVLADVVLIIEYLGRLPYQLGLTVMPLIGKARGGHRAIASLVSLYRLWVRMRREEVRRWEAANDRAYIAAGKGRGPQDAVWRQAARAEAAVATRRQAATLLWDMASFFETIRRVPLWHKARRLDFPLVLLRVALNTYEAPRALSLNGALARPLEAEDGVLAGCGLAMALTKVFTVEALDRVVAALQPQPAPSLHCDDAVTDLDVFVDDIALSVTGEAGDVVNGMEDAAEVLRHELVDVLGCEIEVSKAALVTSSAKLSSTLKKRLGKLAGAADVPPEAAANLGVDYAAGKPRRCHAASGKRRRRMRRLAAKSKRLARIRQLLGKRATAVFTTGPMAEAVYGAAVNGMSNAEVMALRRAAAHAYSPRARGRSLTALMLLYGVPTWKGEVEVVLQYARQAWAATLLGAALPSGSALTLSQLSKIWHGAKANQMLDLPARRAWSSVRGPMGAMVLTLQRIGWRMTGPFTLVDCRGEEVLLTRTPPALLSQMLKVAVIRSLEIKHGATLAATDPAYAERRVAVDHVVAQLARDRTLSLRDRAAYRAVACGAVMTYSRAAKAGYIVQDCCPLCGLHGDTLHHRIWCCAHPDAVAARDAVAPPWLQEEARRSADTDTFWTNGFLPHPGDTWPGPTSTPQALVQYGEGEGDARPDPQEGTHEAPRLGGRLAGDGSCTTNVFPELRRAAMAIVQRRADGSRGWTIQCTVPPPLPQTPQAAEFCVLAVAQRFAHPTADACITSDCANVVAAYNGPPASAVRPGRAYAGIMREVLADASWRGRTSVRKVKAHVNIDTVHDQAERADVIDNDLADRAAKEAVTYHDQPTDVQKAELQARLRRARLVIRTVAKVTQAFPPMPSERLQRPPRSREGASLHVPGAHQWVFNAGFWRCQVCMRMSLQPDLTNAMAQQRCDGPKTSLAAEAVTARGHLLARTEGQVQVLFCVRCGSFSARRAYGLGSACPGAPKPSGQQALARIRKGQQPWETRTAGGLCRGSLGAVLAWDAERSQFVSCGPTPAERRRRRRSEVATCLESSPAEPAGHGLTVVNVDDGRAATQQLGDDALGMPIEMTTAAAPDHDDSAVDIRASADGAVGREGEPSGKRPRLRSQSPRPTRQDSDMVDGSTVPRDVSASVIRNGATTEMEEFSVSGSQLPRPLQGCRLPDAPPAARGSHRLDHPRPREESIEPRAQRRRTADQPPRESHPSGQWLHRRGAGDSTRGPPEEPIRGGSTSLSPRSPPLCSAPHGHSLGPVSGDGGDDDAAAPLRPHVLPEPGRHAAARGDQEHADTRRASRPRDAAAQPARHSPARGLAEHLDGSGLWSSPPSWLYLPSLGIWGGQRHDLDDGVAGRGAKRRRIITGQSGERDHDCSHVDDGSASMVADAECAYRNVPGASADAYPRGFRVQADSIGHGSAHRAQHGGARIQGRDLPGAQVGGGSGGPSRAEARLAAQHASIRRSLDDHADRVARKARAGIVTVQPTAAERMASIRARIVARAAVAPARVETAAAHAASDAAHHGVAHGPADGRQLRPLP